MLLRKVSIQKIFYFSPHLSSASALQCVEIMFFHLNTAYYFTNKHTKHIQITTLSQLNYIHSRSDRLYAPDGSHMSKLWQAKGATFLGGHSAQ